MTATAHEDERGLDFLDQTTEHCTDRAAAALIRRPIARLLRAAIDEWEREHIGPLHEQYTCQNPATRGELSTALLASIFASAIAGDTAAMKIAVRIHDGPEVLRAPEIATVNIVMNFDRAAALNDANLEELTKELNDWKDADTLRERDNDEERS